MPREKPEPDSPVKDTSREPETMNTDIAASLSDGIRRVAGRAASEEDLRIGVEKLLEPALTSLGIEVSPRYETSYPARGSVLRGRSDAVYGQLVIEYESVGTFRTNRGVTHGAKQLDHYIRAELGDETDDALRRAAGVGLDGEQIFFMRYRRASSERWPAPHPRVDT